MVKIILEDWQVKNLREYFGHNDKTQTSHWAYEVFNKAYKEQCNIPIVVSSKNKPKRTLGDFDVWYKPCTRCGYDTAKSTKPKDGNKTCWKCGNFVQRDYTDRALKK